MKVKYLCNENNEITHVLVSNKADGEKYTHTVSLTRAQWFELERAVSCRIDPPTEAEPA